MTQRLEQQRSTNLQDTERRNKKMHNSYLEEIMEMPAAEREEFKALLERHGDNDELRLLAQIEAEEAKHKH